MSDSQVREAWFVIITHKHGNDVYLGDSFKSVRQQLKEYVSENLDEYAKWSETELELVGDVCIEDYFEVVQTEYFDIGSAPVLPAS